jgi:glutathione S-transferase
LTGQRRAVYAGRVITLFMPPATFGIPCLSPFGTKVETYLRMVDLPYRTRNGDPRKNPKGKIPWIEDDGRMVTDSSDIVDYLKAKYGDKLDGQLTPQQRALGLVVRRTLEEHLYWVLVQARWFEPSGWEHTAAFFMKMMPPVIGGLVLNQVIRKSVGKSLYAQGLGRHASADIFRRGNEDTDAVAALLGDQPYMLGDQPTSVDASVFALTSGMLMHPADNPLKARMASHANLVAYNERMLKRYFGDHPPGSSKPA